MQMTVMRGRQLKWWRGFTLFEFAIGVSVMAVLVTVLLQRVQFYQQQGERLAMEQVVVALRASLVAKVASLYVNNKSDEIARLAEQNPMSWLERKPKNYLGEFYAPSVKDIAAGNWYFDRASKNLVYLLEDGNYFPADKVRTVKFKVRLGRLPLTEVELQNVKNSIILDQVNR